MNGLGKFLLNASPFGAMYNNFSRWKGLFSGLRSVGDGLSSWIADNGGRFAEYMDSFANSITGAGLTGQQIQANEMQMQNLEDQYSRQVSGMQKAGLNPALMFESGAMSAPGVSGSPGTGNMSDLLSLVTLPLQMKMMKAQIQNVGADTRKKEAEASNIELLTPAQYNELVSKIQLNNKGIDEADARIAADLAQAALASKETEWYDKLSESEINLRNEEAALASARQASELKRVEEIEQNIRNLKQEVVESAARCVVHAAQAGYLDQSTVNAMEEQGLIEVRRAGARVEYMLNDKILKNYDIDKWFNRWQQGMSGVRDLGLGIGGVYSSGLMAAAPARIGYNK